MQTKVCTRCPERGEQPVTNFHKKGVRLLLFASYAGKSLWQTIIGRAKKSMLIEAVLDATC